MLLMDVGGLLGKYVVLIYIYVIYNYALVFMRIIVYTAEASIVISVHLYGA